MIALGNCYTCEAISTSPESEILEDVSGVHQTGKSNEDVEFLKVSAGNLPFVPKRVVNFFKNLIALEIDSNAVFSISAEDLRPFPQLEYLALFVNNIESIDGDLFYFTPHLKCIALAYNRIQHIGHDLVTVMTDLQYLYFNGNICIDKNAVTRAEVEELGPQLSELCPPIEITTTESTTEQPAVVECTCSDEINDLRGSIQEQNLKIAQLEQANEQLLEMNNAVVGRLSEVERLLGTAKNFVQAFCVEG